jgi:translation initiation factor 1A
MIAKKPFKKKPAFVPRMPSGAPMTQTQIEERIRTPKRHEGEMFAMVVEQKGGSRMIVQCEDGKERLGRIPGRVRKRLWIKDGDYIIIKPWVVEADEKCDLEYRYTPVQADSLKRKGIIRF